MSQLKRFGVALDDETLKHFDSHLKIQSYTNRSEAIRDLIRAEFVRSEWEKKKGDVVCVLTIVYDHHQRGLVNKLLQIQHDQPSEILCTQHVHLDHDKCLEVVIAKGKANNLRKFSTSVKAAKGVKFTGMTLASTGKEV